MEWAIAIVLGVVIKILAEEISAWVPRICRYFITVSVLQLPAHMRERMKEQWTADLNDMPGNIGKLWFSLDLFRVGFDIQEVEKKQTAAPPEQLNFDFSMLSDEQYDEVMKTIQARHEGRMQETREARFVNIYIEGTAGLTCDECKEAAKEHFAQHKCPKCGAILMRREV